MKLPVKTVYSRLNTARETLQKQMREQVKLAVPKVEV
jgi:DNA-directed RNA polymerase specialized sigma24 family protein